MSRIGRIVVAVDGGTPSQRALAWAADEVLGGGSPLWVVTAYAAKNDRHRLRTVEEALRCQRRLCAEVSRTRPWLNNVEQIVGRGPLAVLLARITEPTDLLVLGRTRGCTAARLIQQLSCPIAVVSADGRAVDVTDDEPPLATAAPAGRETVVGAIGG